MPETDGGLLALLVTALVLGLRHGIDWDHLAAIADITSTTSAAEAAEVEHEEAHEDAHAHEHGHGGEAELATHESEPDDHEPHPPHTPVKHRSFLTLERGPVILGTLYALGHALVVALLAGAFLVAGARLPEWVDPIMGRVVGLTLVLLGVWVFVSLYNYVRHGTAFRLRSRWMLAFDALRHGWRRFQAWLHGHEHVEPLEMSSYGPRTAFVVGMVHGVGAETPAQLGLFVALGSAASISLGVPMLVAFIVGLVIANTLVVIVSASGFLASQGRRQVYVVVGALAGVFSLVVGTAFLFEIGLPDLERLLS
jgi:high-affinity nickel-transport protein